MMDLPTHRQGDEDVARETAVESRSVLQSATWGRALAIDLIEEKPIGPVGGAGGGGPS